MEQILAGILEAIEDEMNAQNHYKKLAEQAEDPSIKNFFEQLRLEEEQHENILRTRYQAFSKMSDANKENRK